MTISDIDTSLEEQYQSNSTPTFNRRSSCLLKKPSYHPAKITVSHWQLRDLVQQRHSLENPNEIIYTFDEYIKATDKNTNKITTVCKLDFNPRCFQQCDSFIVAGGVYINSLSVSNNSSSSTLLNRAFSNTSLSNHSNDSNQRGLFAFFNRDTKQQSSIRLGSYINNYVTINKVSNQHYSSFICNNDNFLYNTIIDNTQININDSICLNHPLNHAALSDDCKNLVVLGDCSKIFLLHPNQERYSNTFNGTNLSNDNIIETNSDAGFSTSFDSSGLYFASCFQDGSCLIYDIRNYQRGPIKKIYSTRKNSQNGAFRCVKYSRGTDDLLFISEHVGRIHMIDTRDFNNHQVIMLPVNYSTNNTSSTNQINSDSNIFKPKVLAYDDILTFENNLQHSDYYNYHHHQSFNNYHLEHHNLSNSRASNNFNLLSALSEEEEEEDNDEEENQEHYNREFCQVTSINAPKNNSIVSNHEDQLISSISNNTNLQNRDEGNGDVIPISSINNRYGSEYDYSDNEISGIDWYQDHDGTHLVVGCDLGLINWNIDSWARRSFPSFELL
ncbi:hypothetical protein WICMUC_005750 [Wickerhamomyces mucosus]|uniref:DUF2415 domain-containing protein n=1 Tax=Wickerhamomyces mucosus TaxID=1378264 RepID=A0A9P8P345_9ASCO|nr:hypothetical protein WICMUC_005750 [Wickerhamomyces mucosus]